MTLQAVGALCIAIALIGGGHKISEVEIPRLSVYRIIALVTAGVILIGLGLLTNDGSAQAETPTQISSTSGPSR